MENDIIDEELSQIYEESDRSNVLDSSTFRTPAKNLKLRKPITIEAGQTVQEALTLMRLKQFGCILVIRGHALAGILTERDIVAKALGRENDMSKIFVEDVMTPEPVCFQPEDSIAFVMNSMHVGGYRHVPIVDEQNSPVAVISVRDIIGFIVEKFPEEILNLPPKPMRTTTVLDGG
jgi:CBS domain-containing protein